MSRKNNLLTAAFLIILALASFASAKTYHMTLLTVGEAGDELVGGTAEAYLEIKPGSGRIFLDSFPLTKIDTQISTRYASQIACDYLEMDCQHDDFFYTIRADSALVGGPSASAPLTILTIAALKELDLKNDTVMTGTINSGGSIGPVGGIMKKAEAAQKRGFKRILIPKFSIEEPGSNKSKNNTNPFITSITITTTNNQSPNKTGNSTRVTNRTIEATAPSDGNESNLTIEIVRISNLEGAIPYFLSLPIKSSPEEIDVPEQYTATMLNISDSLCERARQLIKRVKLNATERNRTAEFEGKISASLSEQNYYSAASYCFNLGVFLRRINFREIDSENPTQLEQIRLKALAAAQEFDTNLEGTDIRTLPNLESYIIVKERIIESKQVLELLAGNITSDELAYAVERYYSAVYWSSFFQLSGRPVVLNQEYLREACQKKISEAEERLNYADLYLPNFLESSKKDIDEAYNYSAAKNYKMCLFKASFAKAEANLLLSSMTAGEDRLGELALDKLAVAKKLIAKEEERGFFPAMGYSYYEYANSLNSNNDSISSLVFTEYALELGNLEIYFPKKNLEFPKINYDVLLLTASTLVLGMSLGALLMLNYLSKEKRRQQATGKAKRKK